MDQGILQLFFTLLSQKNEFGQDGVKAKDAKNSAFKLFKKLQKLLTLKKFKYP